jgi:hypothetical protein
MVLSEEVLVGSSVSGAPISRLLCWSPETRSAGTKVVTGAHRRSRRCQSSAWPARKWHGAGGAPALRHLGLWGGARRRRRGAALSERWWRGGGLGSGRQSAASVMGRHRGVEVEVCGQRRCARTAGLTASDSARSDRGAWTADGAVGAGF